jgi:protease II
MSRIYFVEGDTNSMYWAVSGSEENENYEQQFKHIIKDHDFYNNNIYKFTPSSFYSNNNNNPTFNSETEKIRFDKKLLRLAIEKQSENMLVLAPKTYSCSINISSNSSKNKFWIDFKILTRR